MHAQPTGLPGLAALAFGFLLFVISLLLARRAKAKAGTAPERRQPRSMLWIVIQGLGIAVAGIGPIVVARDPLSATALVQAALVLALMLAAVALFHASWRAMGENWSIVARTRDDGGLVQSGPFAQIRHPIYTALGLITLALAVAYGHEANLLLALPLFALGTWGRVRIEEQLLRDRFGPAADSYAARVKRFVPGVF